MKATDEQKINPNPFSRPLKDLTPDDGEAMVRFLEHAQKHLMTACFELRNGGAENLADVDFHLERAQLCVIAVREVRKNG